MWKRAVMILGITLFAAYAGYSFYKADWEGISGECQAAIDELERREARGEGELVKAKDGSVFLVGPSGDFTVVNEECWK